MTVRRRGGGHKRKLPHHRLQARARTACRRRSTSIEYDPNRSAAGSRSCTTRTARSATSSRRSASKVGDKAHERPRRPSRRVGNCKEFGDIPVGLAGAQHRDHSPGVAARWCARPAASAQLPGEGRQVGRHRAASERRGHEGCNIKCRATIGQLGNVEHNLISIGKAGRNRWLGKRPKVRGSAMNPVAHPMGGGEGRRAGGRHPVSSVGRAGQGRQDAQEEARAHGKPHPAAPQEGQAPEVSLRESELCRAASKKVPTSTRSCLRKVEKRMGKRDAIKTWSRSCTIVPDFVGQTFLGPQRQQVSSKSSSRKTWWATSSASSRRRGRSAVTPTRRKAGSNGFRCFDFRHQELSRHRIVGPASPRARRALLPIMVRGMPVNDAAGRPRERTPSGAVRSSCKKVREVRARQREPGPRTST